MGLKLEQGLEAALTNLVSLKQELTQITNALQSTLDHAGDQSQGREAMSHVLRVEAMSVAAHLTKLLALLDPDTHNPATSWARCTTQLENLHRELCRLHHTPLVSKARERCRMALKHRGEADRVEVGLSWRGQRAVVDKLRMQAAVLMPQAIAAVASALGESEALQMVAALSTAEMQFAVQASGLEDALGRLDAAAIRLMEMPSPRSASFEQVSMLTPKSRQVFDDMLMDERQSIFESEASLAEAAPALAA